MSTSARSGTDVGLGFNLGAIVFFAALVGIGVAYFIDNAARQTSSRSATPGVVTKTIAGVEFAIPAEWFRYEDQREEGLSERVDLRLLVDLDETQRAFPVDVALIPRSRARPSAALLDGVYLHRFLPGELSGPPGLVGKPLRGSDGYSNETVWYDALSPSPFVAKCVAPVAGTTSSSCLRTVLYDDVAVVYSFGADGLANWRAFDPSVETMLARAGITRTRR